MNGVLSTDAKVSDAELVAAGPRSSEHGRSQPREGRQSGTMLWAGTMTWASGRRCKASSSMVRKRYNVVALDCGAKHNILRNLVDSGCDVTRAAA